MSCERNISFPTSAISPASRRLGRTATGGSHIRSPACRFRARCRRLERRRSAISGSTRVEECVTRLALTEHPAEFTDAPWIGDFLPSHSTRRSPDWPRQLGIIREERMRRRAFVAGIGSFLAQPWTASAVSPVRSYRVGFLDTAPRERNVNFAAFQQVLLEHGYSEGQNLTFEYRSAGGRNANFAELATELVRLKVDVIVTRGTP